MNLESLENERNLIPGLFFLFGKRVKLCISDSMFSKVIKCFLNKRTVFDCLNIVIDFSCYEEMDIGDRNRRNQN